MEMGIEVGSFGIHKKPIGPNSRRLQVAFNILTV